MNENRDLFDSRSLPGSTTVEFFVVCLKTEVSFKSSNEWQRRQEEGKEVARISSSSPFPSSPLLLLPSSQPSPDLNSSLSPLPPASLSTSLPTSPLPCSKAMASPSPQPEASTSAKPLPSTSSSSSKPSAPSSKPKKKPISPGIVYISRIPPGMTPQKIKHLMGRWGETGKVYAQKDGPSGGAPGSKSKSESMLLVLGRRRPRSVLESSCRSKGWLTNLRLVLQLILFDTPRLGSSSSTSLWRGRLLRC